jgi:hypothetical protein
MKKNEQPTIKEYETEERLRLYSPLSDVNASFKNRFPLTYSSIPTSEYHKVTDKDHPLINELTFSIDKN